MSSFTLNCARNKGDERLHDQSLLKVSVWLDSPLGDQCWTLRYFWRAALQLPVIPKVSPDRRPNRMSPTQRVCGEVCGEAQCMG